VDLRRTSESEARKDQKWRADQQWGRGALAALPRKPEQTRACQARSRAILICDAERKSTLETRTLAAEILLYFFSYTFAACALARDATFLCTTPDFTALSIAET
jgi:hypothetical protein